MPSEGRHGILNLQPLTLQSLIVFQPHSLDRADVKLRHAKGKIAENTVYVCALLSAHADTHGTKGQKGTISQMSDQANNYVLRSIAESIGSRKH